jgi:hypothetical protein
MADEAKTTTKTTMDSQGVKSDKALRPGEYATEAAQPPGPAGFKDSKFTSTAGEAGKSDQSQGTYVEDIPAPTQPEGEAAPVNPGNEAPDVVGRQPGESAEEAGERIAAGQKEADKAAAKTEEKK